MAVLAAGTTHSLPLSEASSKACGHATRVPDPPPIAQLLKQLERRARPIVHFKVSAGPRCGWQSCGRRTGGEVWLNPFNRSLLLEKPRPDAVHPVSNTFMVPNRPLKLVFA